MGVGLGGGRSILKGKGVLCNSSVQRIDEEGSPAKKESGIIKKKLIVARTTMLNPFNLFLEMIFIFFFYFEWRHSPTGQWRMQNRPRRRHRQKAYRKFFLLTG